MRGSKTDPSTGFSTRVLAAAGAMVVTAIAWFAVSWQVGDLVANLTRPTDPAASAAAELALALSPSNPVAHWLKGSAEISLESMERAVRHAPHDHRWRIELGRALEQDEQFSAAEPQFRRAVELAPNYSFARWSLANFLIRQDRAEEAMAELRKAAEGADPYRDQAFSLVWDLYGRDVQRLEAFAGDSSDARARLAYFFAARGLAADALRNWEMLGDADKTANPDILKGMAHGLFLQRHFKESLAFARQAGLDPDAQFEAVTDGSFEKGLGSTRDSRYGWQVNRIDARVDVTGDGKVRRDGNRSARMTFRNSVRPEFYNLSQTVAVEPNTRYRLRFWVRTENLKSAATPLVAIVNANDDLPIGASMPFESGTADWHETVIEISTPANCSGINIRTTRRGCGEECPISGTLWYDEFRLERL